MEREKVEVFGPLSAGDLVVERGSEELVDDARVRAVYKDQKGR